ncbi:MAG: ATP-binding protein [Terriglobia bacterium]
MNSRDNPYAADTASPPHVGDDEILKAAGIQLGRIKAGRAEKSLILVGPRGAGKTALLNRIASDAKAQDYHVAMGKAPENKGWIEMLLPELRRALDDLDAMAGIDHAVKLGLRVLTSFARTVKSGAGGKEIGLDTDVEIETADSGCLEYDLLLLFKALGEAAKARSTLLVIAIDEMHNVPNAGLGALVMAMHQVSQQGLPIALLGAGLPQLVARLGNARPYAERMFHFRHIAAPSQMDAKATLQPP